MPPTIKTTIATIIFAITVLYPGSKVSAQEFYPANMPYMLTDEGLAPGQLAKLNKNYLSQKGFEPLTDSLFTNVKTNERIKLTTAKSKNFIRLTMDYFTSGKNLATFKKRLLGDKHMPFKKINDSLYEQKYKTSVAQIHILKSPEPDDHQLMLLRVVLLYEPQAKPFFRLKEIYPFQNTVWNVALTYRKSESFDDQNYIELALTNTSTANKIEFLDDAHYRFTYKDASDKPQVITGTYDNDISIAFKTDALVTKPKVKPLNDLPARIEEETTPPVSYIEAEKLNKLKYTRKYYEFFLNRYYRIAVFKSHIQLSEWVYNTDNMPVEAPAKRDH